MSKNEDFVIDEKRTRRFSNSDKFVSIDHHPSRMLDSSDQDVEQETSIDLPRCGVHYKSNTELRLVIVVVTKVSPVLRDLPPKRIIISGPSGFLGSRVVDYILQIHEDRIKNHLNPGEAVLLSSSPGKLMHKLVKKYGEEKMRTIRASRVDYYTQHEPDMWRDHLGSMGLEGGNSVFVNLAALAGPVSGNPYAMREVNYKAPVAAAKACQSLGFGHWIQSSTFATFTERAGQVPYSRGKAMADFALCTMEGLPVTIACLGLLYCKNDGVVGQDGLQLNLVDLALLPLTPILGNGKAPVQPQEVMDAAQRIAFLAFSNPAQRPAGRVLKSFAATPTARFYDAVGPEVLTLLEVLQKFAKYNGNDSFRPVHIGYQNMESVLNVASLGNLNRQFVSLLRSEQQSKSLAIGDPTVWTNLLPTETATTTTTTKLTTLDEALSIKAKDRERRRRFPVRTTLKWVWHNPGVIRPGIGVVLETVRGYFNNKTPPP
eukprot:gene11395-23843_t